VAGVTAGLAESNGSLPPGLWLTTPAGWLQRTGISSGTLRSVIEYGLPLPLLLCMHSNTPIHWHELHACVTSAHTVRYSVANPTCHLSKSAFTPSHQTRQNCLVCCVASASAAWTGFPTTQDCRRQKIWSLNTLIAIVHTAWHDIEGTVLSCLMGGVN